MGKPKSLKVWSPVRRMVLYKVSYYSTDCFSLMSPAEVSLFCLTFLPRQRNLIVSPIFTPIPTAAQFLKAPIIKANPRLVENLNRHLFTNNFSQD